MSAKSGKALPQFSSLASLEPFLLEAVQNAGFDRMTPVQASSIPLFLQNKDVVVEAVTGSGKTLAYALPVLHKLSRQASALKEREVGAIVILPTRELAVQVHKVFTDLLEAQPSTSASPIPPPLLLTGGARSTTDDISAFLETNAKILIGTPGRLEEFLLGSSCLANASTSQQQRKIRVVASVKNLDMLVLDEADRLLDLGFAPSITRLLAALPKQRRTGLFSATMTDAITDIVRLGLRNPVRVVVKVEAKTGSLRTPSTLQNQYLNCDPDQKTQQLLSLLRHLSSGDEPAIKFIVYFSTGAAVDYFYKLLTSYSALKKFSFHSLHGHQTASRRNAVYGSFTSQPSSQLAVLLCTDVAARGLDIPSVDCVIQYDPPTDPKTFSHRCGRTARAGQAGRAVVLLLKGREEDYVDFLKLRKVPLSELKLPKEEEENQTPETLFNDLRRVILKDRDLEEKGAKAFVSSIRAYTKHEASFIFRLADVNLPALAKSYALLRLPRMPELKDADKSGWTDAEVDWDNFAYADETREAARRKALAEAKPKDLKHQQASKRSRPPTTEAWTDKKKAKDAKEERRQQRVSALKRVAPGQGQGEDKEPQQQPRSGESIVQQAELEEWREDEREAKRVKKAQSSKNTAVQGMFDADAL